MENSNGIDNVGPSLAEEYTEEDSKIENEMENLKNVYEKYIYTHVFSSETKIEDIIKNFGHLMLHLNIISYPWSKIMPTIKEKCVYLTDLKLCFFYIDEKDFLNVFDNMNFLKKIKIKFVLEGALIFPTTLIDAIKKISRQLKVLHLLSSNDDHQDQDRIFYLPNEISKIDLRNLESLKMTNFAITEEISEMILKLNLKKIHLHLASSIDITTMSNVTNLKQIIIDDVINNNWIKQLGIKAKQLQKLKCDGFNWDNQSLELISRSRNISAIILDVTEDNYYITENGFNPLHNMTKLNDLNLSYCKHLTNIAVRDLCINLKNLANLTVLYTDVDHEITSLIIARNHCTHLHLHVDFDDKNNTFEEIKKDKNVSFQTHHIIDYIYSMN